MRNFVLMLAAMLIAAASVIPGGPTDAHQVPQPCDFTTGGGFVFRHPNDPFTVSTTDEKVNFGLVGGCKNGGFFGHVNIVDRGSVFGMIHVSSTSVDLYTDPFPPSSGYRDICGMANTNTFGPVKYRVRTKDNGEPGGDDRFGYKLTDPIGRTFVLSVRELGPPGPTGGGGNIQLHKPNPSTTGPAVPPDEITACGSDDSGLGM